MTPDTCTGQLLQALTVLKFLYLIFQDIVNNGVRARACDCHVNKHHCMRCPC